MFMGAGPELHGYTEWGSRTPELPSRVLNEHGIFPTVFSELRKAAPDAEMGVLYEWDGIKYLVDTLALNHHAQAPDYNTHPTALCDMACEYIMQKKPVLSAFCFDNPDHVGHGDGHDTPAYYAKLKELDGYVGRIVDAIKEAGIYENSIIIVTADHGGINKGHGGKTMEEMETPFIIAGKNIKKGGPKNRSRKTAAADTTTVGGAVWTLPSDPGPPEIRAEHIEQVITSMTGIPAERLSGSESERLRGLADYLSARVIGQCEAVEKISRSIQRSRAGLKDEGRPIGVFMFVGPTGVGKTLLAKELSKWLFDENKGLIRIDMSEYSEKHNVARLIGSPPGYVGYGEGGQLTEAVRRHPYSVVLFDEIEKAHPEVFNTLLQIFDEGHLTDGSGRKVDFRNTVIILTSNVGSRAAAIRSTQVGYSTCSKSDTQQKAPQSEYRRALEETFAPEFLNRIDDIVIFRTLDLSDVERIIDLELKGLLSRTDRLGYKVEITDEAKRTLAAIGYQRKYGVRALRRTLLERIEEPLSGLIIDGKLHSGERVPRSPSKKVNELLNGGRVR